MRVSEPYKKDSVPLQTKALASFLVQLCVDILCIHFSTGLTLKAFILPIAKFFCTDALIQVILLERNFKVFVNKDSKQDSENCNPPIHAWRCNG